MINRTRGRRIVVVNDRMQRGYRYALVAPMGRNLDPEFRPELTPKQMLRLGVFCGKYMTDCRKEFPASWFQGAKLSSADRDCSLNYFAIDASQPLSVWRKKGWIHRDDPRGWFQWYCRYYMAAACRRRTRARSDAGRQFGATSRRSRAIASRATCCAARVSARRCCIGLTIVARSDRARGTQTVPAARSSSTPFSEVQRATAVPASGTFHCDCALRCDRDAIPETEEYSKWIGIACKATGNS